MEQVFPLLLLAMLGLCVGSFCNVLIFRLPKGEEFVKTPSHCMACGHRLRWYELIPVASWLAQGGKCRSCGAKLSAQYPAVEALNGAAWLLTGWLFRGDPVHTALYCALFSLLLVVAVIDWRTFEIPNGLNLAILLLGAVQLALDREHWTLYLIGMLSVSLFFLLLWAVTRGSALGMGDVKLMGAAGLLLGWPRILLAMIIGSVSGAVIHSVRMRRGVGRKLAFGPYLSAGIWVSALFGERLIAAYLGLFGL
ncbi:MAG: prepilin peptidase [Oscillospiraceae bacterium]|nr:prepilin peptidase [Oscillospiraceae bacterium]